MINLKVRSRCNEKGIRAVSEMIEGFSLPIPIRHSQSEFGKKGGRWNEDQ